MSALTSIGRHSSKFTTAESRASAPTPVAAAEEPRERGVLHYLGLGLSGGLLALMLLVAAVVIVVPFASHSTPYTVLTSSMEPTLPPGTLIVVRPIDPEQIHIGDVVTYQINSGKPAVVTHRITGITTTDTGAKLFTFKGDNNDLPDANLVQEVQIRGKVWYSVPWIGYVNNIVNGAARGFIVPILAGALFLYAGYTIASSVAHSTKSRRRTRAAALAGAQDAETRARTRAIAAKSRHMRASTVDVATEPTSAVAKRIAATAHDHALEKQVSSEV